MADNLKKEKAREKFCNELRRKVEDDEKFLNKIVREENADKIKRRKDFIRRLELERREASLNGVVLKAQEVAALQNNQLVQEEKLAVELDLIRRQEIVDEKLRLHLRQNCHELLELESQLKAAYVKKAIAAQLAEKEARKLQEELRDKQAREIIEKAIGTIEEQENTLRLAMKQQKEEFRHSLQNQIIEKERLKQLEYTAYMKERKMFDEIVKKVKEDEERELKEKRLMQQKLKEEMREFARAKEMWKAKERLVIQQEEEEIKRINEEKEKEKLETKAVVFANRKAQQEATENLLHSHNEKQKKVAEQEAIISALLRNEIEEKENQKAQYERMKELARREEARAVYKKIVAEKMHKKKEERELELQFAHQMKLRIEEENKIENEKLERKRQEELNNLKFNQEAMKQNVRRRAEGLKLTQFINDLEEKEEKKRTELIQEERIRILREHAPKLLGYFPKGCLQKKDLEILQLSGNSPLSESCPLQNLDNNELPET